jgi:hypothetical protein
LTSSESTLSVWPMIVTGPASWDSIRRAASSRASSAFSSRSEELESNSTSELIATVVVSASRCSRIGWARSWDSASIGSSGASSTAARSSGSSAPSTAGTSASTTGTSTNSGSFGT